MYICILYKCTYTYINVYIYVCTLYVCMYVRTYVRTYVYPKIKIYICCAFVCAIYQWLRMKLYYTMYFIESYVLT